MPQVFPIHFVHPIALALAMGLSCVVVVIVMLRRPAISFFCKIFVAAGLIFLSLAAGGMSWHLAAAREIVVMVDLSPSTRGAEFRNADALAGRVRQLVGDAPHRIVYFSDHIVDATGETMPKEMPSERTVFSPPPAGAIVLFSDGRFELPEAAPPTYIVIDPGLEQAADGSIQRLEWRGRQLAATVHNTGGRRDLTFEGTAGPSNFSIEDESRIVTRPLMKNVAEASARLGPGDPWPENDALTIEVSPPIHTQRWWVGGASPPGWRQFSAAELPLDAGDYLLPSVIVLNNIAADDLSSTQQQRLQQYVRNLGGAMIILGGDRAFAAGGYAGGVLESLSPLAGSPPQPMVHWMLLADSSGSMSADAGGLSRWQVAGEALFTALPHLPPDDLVSIGHFAEQLQWWTQGQPARLAAAVPKPDIVPTGPTNLQSALDRIATEADSAMPKHLLILTDGEARLEDAERLTEAMKAKKIHLHLLAIGRGNGLAALRRIVDDTGGVFLEQLDPKKWTAGVAELVRGALPERLSQSSINVRFIDEAAGISARSVALWNRTWMKDSAAALAEAEVNGERVVMAAGWRAGAGRVIAVAFQADGRTADFLADLIASPPRDPRFEVSWEPGPSLRVRVDAAEGGDYENGLKLMLQITPRLPSDSPEVVQMIPQISPGRYELSLPAPRKPGFLTMRHDGRLIDRVIFAGRYAQEFDKIGNDLDALKTLAERSGGAMIDPRQTRRIHFNWPRREVSLASWLAAGGALLIAAGVIKWRRA